VFPVDVTANNKSVFIQYSSWFVQKLGYLFLQRTLGSSFLAYSDDRQHNIHFNWRSRVCSRIAVKS